MCVHIYFSILCFGVGKYLLDMRNEQQAVNNDKLCAGDDHDDEAFEKESERASEHNIHPCWCLLLKNIS